MYFYRTVNEQLLNEIKNSINNSMKSLNRDIFKCEVCSTSILKFAE